jgi:DNA-binding SARP family transcriptional activator
MRQKTRTTEGSSSGAPTPIRSSSLEILSLRLLGPMQIRSGAGELITLPTRKAQALLAYLAVRPGEDHSREKLATLFWGGRGNEQARQSLRQTLLTLRKALAPADSMLLHKEGETVRLETGLIRLDTSELEALDSGDDEMLLSAEAKLPPGEFLEGLVLEEESFDNWLRSERERWYETTLRLMTRLANLQSALGRTEAATQTAFRILALDPLNEATHRQLMRLFVRSGRREAAIKQFHTCADLLHKRLGVLPDSETVQLFNEISRGTVAEDAPVETMREQRAILLIEDNALNRELVRAVLARSPYELVVVEDGAQALLQLGARQFDLILLDLALPTLDGFTLIEVLRRNGIEAPIIVLTAFLDEEHEVRAFEAGAVDFIRKPFHAASLLKRIERALAENRKSMP